MQEVVEERIGAAEEADEGVEGLDWDLDIPVLVAGLVEEVVVVS